ncbi:hypothetical protein ROHU_000924 [Labeo rohita]|uniref:Uncharacterized protein n=1 Tax=Labeo rohita TaxID=84645 RepID=A0A498M5R0_LABRO|nr:hypothetical protein ROHU_009934 [Labeo rohita]RXN38655.1 hypothetical protein ROHU_000924 [Labeo rohita]
MGGFSRQLLGDQDSRRCTRRGEEMWNLACQERTEKGKPTWEGSRGNCWEIKTPGVAPGGGKKTWSMACQARMEKGKPAWEGSRSNCWEINTAGVAPGGGKRRGLWPARQGWRKANPPGRALVATAGRSTLQVLHQAGGRDVEYGLPGKDGERQTRLGGLSYQLLGDQDSRRCTRRGEETWSLACQERTEKDKPVWEGSCGN